MSRNRLNPWPSVADLFSALTVVAFAALIFVTLNAVIIDENRKLEIRAAKDLAAYFQSQYKRTDGVQADVQPCEDRKADQCIEISFRFVEDKSDLRGDGVAQVDQACNIYKEAVAKVLDQINAENKNRLDPSNFVLIIEGHTDEKLPTKIRLSESESFLYNWKLSSARAASVLYQFQKCGVSRKTGYEIYPVGLADTRPLCKDPQPDDRCNEQNRRTTMRIRVTRNDAPAQ